ncbi:MAG TPA: hypothetical protein VK171_16980 [Fimbriimonas sp.]|nr:hypothetical protein [Fimbriimonas sp.]
MDEAEARIKSQVKRFEKIISVAATKGVNEADTRDIVKAVAADILGFDPFFDVTGEFSVKGQFADFAVKIEEAIKFFIEVKSVGTKLDEKHLYQVIGYAANHGVEWAVLTNSDRWIVYRLFAGSEKRTTVVFDVSVSSSSTAELIACFLAISKEGFKQNLLATRWESVEALAPKKIAEIAISQPVLQVIRRELQKATGFRASEETLSEILVNRIFRGDVADGIK